jgi:hypothetical protein
MNRSTHTGWPGFDPAALFKPRVLGFLYGIASPAGGRTCLHRVPAGQPALLLA